MCVVYVQVVLPLDLSSAVALAGGGGEGREDETLGDKGTLVSNPNPDPDPEPDPDPDPDPKPNPIPNLGDKWRDGRRDGLLSLASKAPEWSEELKTYTLEYNNRATLASVKNIQLKPSP